jgi:hypothetical protein
MCNRKIKFFKNKNVNKLSKTFDSELQRMKYQDKINSMKILNKMIDSQVLENNLYFENIFK